MKQSASAPRKKMVPSDNTNRRWMEFAARQQSAPSPQPRQGRKKIAQRFIVGSHANKNQVPTGTADSSATVSAYGVPPLGGSDSPIPTDNITRSVLRACRATIVEAIKIGGIGSATGIIEVDAIDQIAKALDLRDLYHKYRQVILRALWHYDTQASREAYEAIHFSRPPNP